VDRVLKANTNVVTLANAYSNAPNTTMTKKRKLANKTKMEYMRIINDLSRFPSQLSRGMSQLSINTQTGTPTIATEEMRHKSCSVCDGNEYDHAITIFE
jgi:hypothetical protein